MGWTRNVQNGLFRIELRGKIVVTIQKCTIDDCEYLAELNKELIHAEGSDNPITIRELEQRMKDFLQTFYEAYFFIERDRVVGYALIKKGEVIKVLWIMQDMRLPKKIMTILKKRLNELQSSQRFPCRT